MRNPDLFIATFFCTSDKTMTTLYFDKNWIMKAGHSSAAIRVRLFMISVTGKYYDRSTTHVDNHHQFPLRQKL